MCNIILQKHLFEPCHDANLFWYLAPKALALGVSEHLPSAERLYRCPKRELVYSPLLEHENFVN